MAKNQRTLNPLEQAQLIDTAEDHGQQEAMLIKTALFHGTRNIETVTLQRKHIDLQPVRIKIERKNTKSEAGVRKIPTPNHFKSEFTQYVEQYDDKEDYIFPSKRGGHITERTFQNIVQRVAKDAGLISGDESDYQEKVVPHTLRHTYGTTLHENGMDLKSLSSLMGHSSVEVTADLYVHLATEKLRDEVSSAFNHWR